MINHSIRRLEGQGKATQQKDKATQQNAHVQEVLAALGGIQTSETHIACTTIHRIGLTTI